MPQTGFVIHHLTDIHLGSLHYRPTLKIGVAPASTGARNIRLYREHLRSVEPAARPDLVVVSGDLTSSATQDEIDLVEDELAAILELVKAKNPAWRASTAAPFLVIVPGNHDLDWDRSTHPARIERYARLADGLFARGGVLSSVYKSANAIDHVDFGDDVNLFLGLFDSTQLGGAQDPELLAVHATLLQQFRHAPQATATADVEQALSTLQGKARLDPGYVEASRLTRMEEQTRKCPSGRIKVAVLHHNLTSVPSDDIDAFDIVINAGIVKQSLARAGFDLVLSGHRHIFHCSQEFMPSGAGNARQSIVFVSGDSLGCKAEAPFAAIRLTDASRAHRSDPPVALLEVENHRHIAGSYAKDATSTFEVAVSRELDKLARAVRANIGRPKEEVGADRDELLEALRLMLPAMQQLQSEMVDWSASAEWIRKFHFQLGAYHSIYATDVYRRFSIENPHYEMYLQAQYMERLKRLRQDQSRTLQFSKVVYDAIVRTGWTPSPVLWGDRTITVADDGGGVNQLEIVRVLVRPSGTERERQILATLDFEHKLFAIPLFVIDPSALPASARVDFALGIGGDRKLQRSYEYSEKVGTVEEREPTTRGETLLNMFESILRKPQLMTMVQFLGDMIPDPTQMREFAGSYDESRRASPQIVNVLRRHFPEDGRRTGLDIGCGTGNYTMPFVGDFETVIGLDTSMEMLAVAKRKSASVRWMLANAIHTGLHDQSCDAVWLISTLHYFEGERQRLLFAELRRILRPGGVLIADTEFAEQHESLWLKYFFPSLREKYRNAVLPTDTYRKWFKEAGFASVDFETLEYMADEGDAFLRIGQHEPRKYLEAPVIAGLPAFQTMNLDERRVGLRKLEQSIDDGSIDVIIGDYTARATMPGDVGFIVARR